MDYLQSALCVTRADRQLLTTDEFMEWIFSNGTKQADEWYQQILPVAQLAGYKTMFRDEYIKRRTKQVRNEFSLDICQRLDIFALDEYSSLLIPPGYQMHEVKGILHFNAEALEWKTVFPHPVIISRRFENIQKGEHIVKLIYCDLGKVKTLDCDLYTISNTQAVGTLARRGLRVTSENSRFLVQFLSQFLNVNIDKIPVEKSTSVLGWNEEKFLPYSQDIEFDGAESTKDIFNAVKCVGNYDLWKKEISKTLKNDFVRLYVATSFASPLLKITGKQNFITHLWGKTGTAKTVALYIALSVWGKPDVISCQWNATVVAAEQTAIVLNNIPMSMNESELLAGNRGAFHSHQDFIYMFCEGKSKPRGEKVGGLQVGGTWQSTCLSNGEGSLIGNESKEGEINRVLEFQTDEKLLNDEERAIFIASLVKENYGYAGAEFTEKCGNYPLKEIWNRLFENIKDHATGKQAGQLSSLLLGDYLMQVIIYGTAEEKAFIKSLALFDRIKSSLKKDSDIDISARAENYIKSWISQNINSFLGVESLNDRHEPAQIYGSVGTGTERDLVYINNSVFDKVMSEKGFNLGKIRKDFKERGVFARVGAKSSTVQKKIKGKKVRCYCIGFGDEEDEKNDMDEFQEIEDIAELPFQEKLGTT